LYHFFALNIFLKIYQCLLSLVFGQDFERQVEVTGGVGDLLAFEAILREHLELVARMQGFDHVAMNVTLQFLLLVNLLVSVDLDCKLFHLVKVFAHIEVCFVAGLNDEEALFPLKGLFVIK